MERNCPLTGEICKNPNCTDECYGEQVLEYIKNLTPYSPGLSGVIQDLTPKQVKAIEARLNPPQAETRRLKNFEDFLDNLPSLKSLKP